MAVVRYIELWGTRPICSHKFIAGVKGTDKLLRSFAGRLAGLNTKPGRLKKTKQHIVGKWPEWEWEVLDHSQIYKEVPRLPEEGKEIARQLAWSMKNYNK